ncbi:DUF1566 domain-containing protein, partial [Candidatus Saccharibacteria bacterium]|nr:DUF1566 domain-containing protein [Candidatus Saccharibacteria bacterium]
RARGLKRLISALGITLLVAVFCGIIGITSHKALAESSANMNLKASISDITIDITLPQTAQVISLTPNASLETIETPILVTTTNPGGYTLIMNGNTTDLTRTAAMDGVYPTIPTLDQATSPAEFAVNHWGYRLPSDATFSPFNNEGITVGQAREAVEDKQETIIFGAKVNSLTPIGDYEITLNFTAIATPPMTINNVNYMQEFKTMSENDKSSVLASMNEGTSYPITDSRDNTPYTIAKIGNQVWMTKNLDLAGGTTLTPQNSNVTSSYTLPASSASGFSSDSTAYVYNSGSTTCASDSPCYSYYSYLAATAGTNPSSGNATSDICPAGWRLPTKSEYETLMGTYNTGAKLTASPFLAVYAGTYNTSSLGNGGSVGYYWSSTAYSSSNAYGLRFNSSGAVVDNYNKRNGFSVRCVQS